MTRVISSSFPVSKVVAVGRLHAWPSFCALSWHLMARVAWLDYLYSCAHRY